ncbi:MAG: hypothetical protein JJE52_06505 [Acidimicrobiia bacterium]|nr:hypothetical protein [Acidimicrobiia bacterium]
MLVLASAIAVWLLVGDDGSERNHQELALCRELVDVGDHAWADVDVIAFIEPEVSTSDMDELVEWVEGRPGVVRARFIGHDEAYEEFAGLYADSPEMIEAIEPGNIPPSIRVTLEPGAERLTDAEGRPGVYRVVDRNDSFPDGIRPIDVMIRPLAEGRISGPLYSAIAAADVAWRGYQLGSLIEVAPDDLAADLETIERSIGEWGESGVPPAVEPAATRIVDFFETSCDVD